MFRPNRFLTLFLATAALVGTTACDDDDDGTGPTQTGRVRVVHAIGNAPAVDVTVDGAAAFTNVAFRNTPVYANVAVGARDFGVRATGTAANLLTVADVPVAAGVDYTAVALGRLGAAGALAPTVRLIVDDAAPPAGQASVRVLHASPAAGDVDVYVTATDANLANEAPDIIDLEFNENPPVANIPAGTYRIRVTPTGTKTVAIDVNNVTLAGGQKWLAIALGDNAPGTGNPSAFELRLVPENGN